MDPVAEPEGLISQRLLPRQQGWGRVAAVEIMLNTPLVSDLIFKGEVAEMGDHEAPAELGMQTFDQSRPLTLYEGNLVTLEDALRNADSVNDLRLQTSRTASARAAPTWRRAPSTWTIV